MKTTREKIEVMEAFERGEEIEVSINYDKAAPWEDQNWAHIKNPAWDWDEHDYRVKDNKPKIEDLIKTGWVKAVVTGWAEQISAVNTCAEKIRVGNYTLSFKEAIEIFRSCESPIGKAE